jgi:tetratricopeptide (TPR) repeat protein
LAAAPAKGAVAPAATSGVDYEFVVDPGTELLAAVVSLARPTAGGPRPGEFSALKEHPTVKRLKAALDRGVPATTLSQLLLSVGEPPRLVERGPLSRGLEEQLGGESEAEALLADLRDFARTPDWTKAWEARRAVNAGLVRRAQAETRRTLSPMAVEAWLGARFKDRYLFILSDDLAPSSAVNASFEEGGRRVDARERAVMGWRDGEAHFSFDDFAATVAHELTHTVTDPIALARQKPLAAFSSLMVPGCTDSWTGCVLEHVNLAATLRALRAESGEAAYRAMLKDYTGRGFPYLPALCARFAEFEAPAVKARGFAAFFPRVEDVFRAALRARGGAHLEADLAGFADFSVDPRVELVSVLLRLSGTVRGKGRARGDEERLVDARFSAFAAHPAAARVAALSRGGAAAGQLPLRLALALGDPPEFDAGRLPPEPWLSAVGGAAGFRAFAADLRAFAKDARFAAFRDAARPLHRGYVAEARAEARRELNPRAAVSYLGAAPSRARFLLSGILPSSYGTDFVLDEGTAAVRTFVWPAAEQPGPARFRFDQFGDSLVHELVHTVTDPLVPEGFASGGKVPSGCNDGAGAAAWRACAQEHLVYAVTLRLLAADDGEEAARILTADYVDRGFPRLPELVERLKEYEKDRKRWPRLEDFAPRLLEVFASPLVEGAGARDAQAQTLMAKGVTAYLAGDVPGAVKLLREARKLSPEDAEIALNLAVSLGKAGDAGGEAAEYDRAIALGLSEKNRRWEIAAAALSSRASLRQGLGRRDEARTDLEQALSIVPPDWSGRPELLKRLEAARSAR